MALILPRIEEKRQVAVIGAGIAGLSCASTLTKAGMQVTVFEKSRSVAGRMSTRKGDGWQCDHGARYFTARDPAFQEEIAAWLEQGVAAQWHTPIGVYENQAWHSSKPSDARYVGTPWMTSPAHHLAKSLEIQTNHTITSLNRLQGQWRLHTAEHGLLDYQPDWVVLAIPAPQAFALTKVIDPAISGLHDKAQTEGCWTMMLRLNQAITMPFEAAFINDGILSWVARNNAKPQRTGEEVWVIHAQSQWSQDYIDADPLAIAAQMIAAFIALGGKTPAEYAIHRWRYASSDTSYQERFHCDFERSIGYCGDWLHGGRVEGAWLSGQALANTIIAAH
jgi:predicted NAD/FAD-dependent oxidoreductase